MSVKQFICVRVSKHLDSEGGLFYGGGCVCVCVWGGGGGGIAFIFAYVAVCVRP